MDKLDTFFFKPETKEDTNISFYFLQINHSDFSHQKKQSEDYVPSVQNIQVQIEHALCFCPAK